MDRHARTPDPLPTTGNMSENWRNWREDFLIFMTVTEYNKKTSEMKANMLKNLIGKFGLQVINNFTYNDPSDKDDFGIILSKLNNHFDPAKTETQKRYEFFTIKRQPKEDIKDYIKTLRDRAKQCNFGPVTESLVRDKAVLDTKDSALRKKYLSVESLTVDRLIAMAIDHETMLQKIKQISKENTDGTASTPNEKKRDGCWRCGRRHPPKNCPAWGAKCEKCGERHHFGYCCPKSKESVKGKDIDKNTFDSFYHNNTMKKDNNNPFNSLGPTPSTSGGPHINQNALQNEVKLPNNITGHTNNTQQLSAAQSNINRNQLLKPCTKSAQPSQIRQESEFVLVSPPTNNLFADHQRQQPNPVYSRPYKNKSKKKEECVIS